MKIRSKINLLLVVVFLLASISLSGVLFIAPETERQMSELSSAEKLIISAAQLRQIAVETVLFHEPRARSQWQLKLASMKSEIDGMSFRDANDRKKLDRIRENIELAQISYARMFEVNTASVGITNPRLAQDQAFVETRTITSLLVITQELIDTGRGLMVSNRQQVRQTIRLMSVSITLFVLLMAGLTVFVWRLVKRDLLHPLRIFEQGAQQIGVGNYSHRLNIPQRDEVGELASEFDSMVEHVEKVNLELEEQRSHLSETVVSRTKDLEAAKEIAETLAKYARSLIEASLDPLVTISLQGKINDVNEASVQATGVLREQLIGTDFFDYFTEPDKARIGYQKVFSEGLVRNYPLAIRHVNGSIMDVLYNASVYKDDKGNVLGVFAAARDVTQQKLLDQQLREKNIELEGSKIAAEKANIAKSDFLSHMSHELRTPLNAILGFAQLLETGTPSPTPGQVIRLNQILKAGWYLLELINEILDLALIESGKSSMSMEQVSLSAVLFECRAMFKPQAKENGIHLNFLLLDSTWFVHADQTKLKQVIANLLSNAIKYNSDNGTVEVKCSENTAGRLRISVKDSGAGLSAEKLAHLFQPFNRLGQEVGIKEGTGIGLAVSKKLVEMMGGTIGVESTVGVGSEFWIELDRDDASQPAAETKLPEEFVSPHKGNAASYTLLYVEDNLANLMLVEQIIEDRPHIRMLSARDGPRGVALAQEQLPDIILMDINLPGISGIEAMTLLRKDPATKHIPIIALSANAMLRDIDQGLEAGFFRYLTKPIKINEFVEALDAAIPSVGKKKPSA